MVTISEALGIALRHHQAGRLQAAEQIYRQILAAEPDHVDALQLLGVAAHQVGKHEAAIEYIGRAIALKGTEAVFHNNQGEAYRALGRIPEAIACYRRALQYKPAYAEAENNLGIALQNQGKLVEAIACYRRALALKPDYAEAHNNLGNALREQGKLDEAVACYLRALELTPEFAEPYSNLGNVLRDQGKLDEAVACCRRAVQLKPDYAEAHGNLGIALQNQGKLDEAIACYRCALELKPDFVRTHYNLGIALNDQAKLDEAATCFRRALELKPDFAEAHNNLGLALHDQGYVDEALACYERALALSPELADAHANRALAWLATGDWQHGWPEYEWRWRLPHMPPRPFPQPLWCGEPLEGKTILLHAEQGFGDTIQFVRYASIVKQQGATVIVQCQKRLLRLLEGCPGVDQLLGQGDPLPAFDVQAPLLSVGGILKISPQTVPADIPYLFPQPELFQRWRNRLRALDGFKIGIDWQGSPGYRKDRFRSIPLRCFAPLARIPGVRLMSLQKGLGSEQLAEVCDLFPVTDLAAELDELSGPFLDTAAAVKNLDLVITADTVSGHLAGSLGVPVWVALAVAPDWRWLLGRCESPWYPTMRLFQQREPGNWPGVFAEIAAALSLRLR